MTTDLVPPILDSDRFTSHRPLPCPHFIGVSLCPRIIRAVPRIVCDEGPLVESDSDDTGVPPRKLHDRSRLGLAGLYIVVAWVKLVGEVAIEVFAVLVIALMAGKAVGVEAGDKVDAGRGQVIQSDGVTGPEKPARRTVERKKQQQQQYGSRVEGQRGVQSAMLNAVSSLMLV